MCVKGWKIDRFNPAKIPVITHEMDHEPEFLDLRGGPKTAGSSRCIVGEANSRSCRYTRADKVKCSSILGIQITNYVTGIDPSNCKWPWRY